ncbi:Uncharacterized small protein (DUF2292) [Methylophilaceae bacterium 11]|jgi:hypothetical protein|uniref:YezD family protein n=1 Tax=Methylotenera sp. N17 TaxID=1502761 RepID=UPI00044C590D|nr:YezD family protein [Methylotenera sp. N17]EUJ11231.1 Uncharacterized small protein (DUF2292) [Methylophilaceae bacterium 11]
MSLVQPKFTQENDEAVLTAIANAISLIQKQTGYGSVEITVHDGRVTQIERREKVRFETKSTAFKK